MFPLVLTSGVSLSAYADDTFECSVVCTYLESDQVHTTASVVELSLSSTTLLDAPVSGGRVVRQLILVNTGNILQRVTLEMSSYPIARFYLQPTQTYTFGGAYDNRGRLNPANAWGATSTTVLDTDYTISQSYEWIGRFFVFNSSAPCIFTLGNTYGLPIGVRVYVARVGAGSVTIRPLNTSVALNGVFGVPGGVELPQWGMATLHLHANNMWLVNFGGVP